MSNMSYLPKVISSEPNRVNSLLIETITLLCRNGLSFAKQLKIEGMIGITIDDSEIALIHINEFLYPNNCSMDSQQQHGKNKSQPSSYNKSTNDNVDCSEFTEKTTSFSMNEKQTMEGDLKSNGNTEFIVESPFLFNGELPSDEEENHVQIDKKANSNQMQNHAEESNVRSACYDPPRPSDAIDKSGDSDEPPLGAGRIKCETIDITDEEECEDDYGRNEGQFVSGLEGIFGGNCPSIEPVFQRGSSNSRAFRNRELCLDDATNIKPIIPPDDFLVSMNLEGMMSEHRSVPRIRGDAGWPGTSNYNHSIADVDYDSGYQFVPRKRMVGSVDNRPYACPVEGCDRRFFHRNNVYRHRKQKHPLEVIFKT